MQFRVGINVGDVIYDERITATASTWRPAGGAAEPGHLHSQQGSQ
jgi:hypothetical protein